MLPVPTWKGALVVYGILAATVIGGCLAIFGVTRPEEWTQTWLPTIAGPAIFVGLYWLVAHLGERRIERMIEDND